MMLAEGRGDRPDTGEGTEEGCCPPSVERGSCHRGGGGGECGSPPSTGDMQHACCHNQGASAQAVCWVSPQGVVQGEAAEGGGGCEANEEWEEGDDR